jgi:lipopolysaccharide/colanic/teichoic acid biosynthesis glycosyltransferase
MLNYNINKYSAPLSKVEHADAMDGLQLAVKRLLDIVFSILCMILFLPLMIVFSVILMFDKGPVIFKQERIGYKGRPFMIYKFRTMKNDAESDGIPRLEDERNRHITPFGRFLRSHHLDELPQLWNVLKGDMSFVGPRPERQFFIDQINRETDDYRYIYLMRPGVTSYAYGLDFTYIEQTWDEQDIIISQRLIGNASVHHALYIDGKISQSLVGIGAAQERSGRKSILAKSPGSLNQSSYGSYLAVYLKLAGTEDRTAYFSHI